MTTDMMNDTPITQDEEVNLSVVADETPEVALTVEPEVSEEESEEHRLRARVAELEEELERRDTLSARMTRECAEFEQYFPDVSLRKLPNSVWAQVRQGVPLAAAYALYERGLQNERAEAERQNERNAQRTAGLPSCAGANYFSPAQVRAMSRDEVREHYDRIFESMRHWQ
jgi:hypothetical protein